MPRRVAQHVPPPPRHLLAPRRRGEVRALIRAALAGTALGLLSLSAAAAETHTGPIGALFCETLPSFRSVVAAMLAHDEAAAAHLADCTFLKPGVRVEVLRELAALGPEVRIVAVRVYGNGASVDGFTLSSNLGDALPPPLE